MLPRPSLGLICVGNVLTGFNYTVFSLNECIHFNSLYSFSEGNFTHMAFPFSLAHERVIYSHDPCTVLPVVAHYSEYSNTLLTYITV